jgi:hypothetical protein
MNFGEKNFVVAFRAVSKMRLLTLIGSYVATVESTVTPIVISQEVVDGVATSENTQIGVVTENYMELSSTFNSDAGKTVRYTSTIGVTGSIDESLRDALLALDDDLGLRLASIQKALELAERELGIQEDVSSTHLSRGLPVEF